MLNGKDANFFNCSENHELDYIKNLHTAPDKVEKFIKEGCKNGTITYWSRGKLYEYQQQSGFINK